MNTSCVHIGCCSWLYVHYIYADLYACMVTAWGICDEELFSTRLPFLSLLWPAFSAAGRGSGIFKHIVVMVKLDGKKHVAFRLTLDVILSWAELIMFTSVLLLKVAKIVLLFFGFFFLVLGFYSQTEFINVFCVLSFFLSFFLFLHPPSEQSTHVF